MAKIEYKDIPLLAANDIEVKVKQVSENGAVLLLYKTARTDYKYLNKLFGLYNWQCHYHEVKGNLFCVISIYDEDTMQWVDKTNCGIESRADDEGNEKKGEASDSLKRAGFTLGIGVELYTSPFIFVKVPVKKNEKGRYELANRYQKFSVKTITYNEDREIDTLVIIDSDTRKVVFTYGTLKEESKSQLDFPTLVNPNEEDKLYDKIIEDKNNEILEDEVNVYERSVEENEDKEEAVKVFPTDDDKEEVKKSTITKTTKARLETLYASFSLERRENINKWLKKTFNKNDISELGEFEAQITISTMEKVQRKSSNE